MQLPRYSSGVKQRPYEISKITRKKSSTGLGDEEIDKMLQKRSKFIELFCLNFLFGFKFNKEELTTVGSAKNANEK